MIIKENQRKSNRVRRIINKETERAKDRRKIDEILKEESNSLNIKMIRDRRRNQYELSEDERAKERDRKR